MKATEIFWATCWTLFAQSYDGAVRTFPRLRLIWGRTTTTTTTKAASERGNFFLHALFFVVFALCLVQYRSSLGSRSTSRSHGVVLLEDLFGRPVRSVGLSVVVNNKMFCFNHIVVSSYAYALTEGEGDRRAWDSFSFSISFTFTFAFTLLVPLPLASTPTSFLAALFLLLLLLWLLFALGGVRKIFFIVGSSCYCSCCCCCCYYCVVDGVMMWESFQNGLKLRII